MNTPDVLTSLLCPALIVVTLGYAALCALSPFGNCSHCSGVTTRGRYFPHDCHHCAGTGLQVRLGRQIWTFLKHEYQDGHR